jgi:hypothetical protein
MGVEREVEAMGMREVDATGMREAKTTEASWFGRGRRMFDLTALMAGASAGLAEEEDGLAEEEAGFVDFEVDATGGEGDRGRGRGLFEGERSASCFEMSAKRKLS